jgi:hypothetical protein
MIDQAARDRSCSQPEMSAGLRRAMVGDEWTDVRPKQQRARARQSRGGEIVQTPIGRVITDPGMWVIVLANGDRWIAPPDGFKAFWVLDPEGSEVGDG